MNEEKDPHAVALAQKSHERFIGMSKEEKSAYFSKIRKGIKVSKLKAK